MTTYFGGPWPSGVCEAGEQVETPVGVECFSCKEEIREGDQGSFVWTVVKRPVHKECSLRDVLGGIGHLTNHLYWCVGEKDPDGGRSRRESAVLVWEWVSAHGFSDPEEE